MGKRGSIATGAKRTAGKSVFASESYLAPTVGMSKRAKTIWKHLVAAFPGNFFTESDRILLEQYCEAAALHRMSTGVLVKDGWRFKDNNGVWRKNTVALDVQHQARCDCSMLATKLRITKQAMISPKGAGRAASDAVAAAEAMSGGGDFGDLLYGGDAHVQQ